MLRRTAVLIGALLAVFHVWLLAGQAWSGELFEAARLVRWVIAAGAFGAIVAVSRRGASIFRGRTALTIWLVAALLHGPALAHRLGGLEAIPQVVTTLSQVALASALGALLALARWWSVRRRVSALRRPRHLAVFGHLSGALAAGALPHLASRPPPQA